MSKADSLDARLEALESLPAPALRLERERVTATAAPAEFELASQQFSGI